MYVPINQSSNVGPTSRRPKHETPLFRLKWMRYVALTFIYVLTGVGSIVFLHCFSLVNSQFMTLRRLNLEIQGYPESYATASHMMENRIIGEPHPYAIGDSGVMSHMGYMGNESIMGQVSVPLHVASQSTPMTAESQDVPQEKPPSPSPTMDPLGGEPPVDEVPVEAEKATA